MPRQATVSERFVTAPHEVEVKANDNLRALSSVFIDLLKDISHRDTGLYDMSYTSPCAGESIIIPSKLNQATSHKDSNENLAEASVLNIAITTPEFYHRLVSYSTVDTMVTGEIIAAIAEENSTILVSSVETFRNMLSLADPEPLLELDRYWKQDMLGRVEWAIIFWLRRPPRPGFYPDSGTPHARMRAQGTAGQCEKAESCSRSMSDKPSFLDDFVLKTYDRRMQADYRLNTIRILLADRISFGDEGFLDVLQLFARWLACITGAWALWKWLLPRVVPNLNSTNWILLILIAFSIKISGQKAHVRQWLL